MESNKTNCIEKVFYEHDSLKLVMFRRKSDDKIILVPKSAIVGGWSEDREKSQNIKLKLSSLFIFYFS